MMHAGQQSTPQPPARSLSNPSREAPESLPKRRKMGRPTKYKPRYCQMIVDYFDQRPWIEEVPYTITSKNGNVIEKVEIRPKHLRFLIGFADSIGVNINSIKEWVKVHDDFSAAYAHAKDLYKEHLGICGSLGLFNSHFTQFLAKNTTDWTDEQKVTHEGEITSVHFFETMLDKARQTDAWQAPALSAN